MDKWIEIFVTLTAVFIFIQVGILAGVFVSLRKLAFNVERIRTDVEQRVHPAVADFRDAVGEARHVLKNFRGASENIANVSETIRHQVERVNGVIQETTDRARVQISRADDVVTDAIQRMEATSAIVQDNILAPIREASAIIRGVHGGLHFLFARRKNSVDQVHQDEELFI